MKWNYKLIILEFYIKDIKWKWEINVLTREWELLLNSLKIVYKKNKIRKINNLQTKQHHQILIRIRFMAAWIHLYKIVISNKFVLPMKAKFKKCNRVEYFYKKKEKRFLSKKLKIKFLIKYIMSSPNFKNINLPKYNAK